LEAEQVVDGSTFLFLGNVWSVNESLKDSLLSFPLSDKIFGLSVQDVQEEMKKLPQPVKGSVQVTNGKRSVVTNPPSVSTHGNFLPLTQKVSKSPSIRNRGEQNRKLFLPLGRCQ
jgi:hypothetical protein